MAQTMPQPQNPDAANPAAEENDPILSPEDAGPDALAQPAEEQPDRDGQAAQADDATQADGVTQADDAMQATQAKLKAKLIEAEIARLGAEMKLIDPEAAWRLMDATAVTVTDDGAVIGLREALETLRQSKSYLFAQGGAWAQRVGNGGLPRLTGVEEAFYRKNPALRKPTA